MQENYKTLEWKYFDPPKISNSFQNIVAQHDFKLPDWMREKVDCTIDITLDKYNGCYCARIWWFNRGVNLVDAYDSVKSLKDCINLVDKRMVEFIKIFSY